MAAATNKGRKNFKKSKRKKMDAPNVRTKMYNKKTRKVQSFLKETGAPGVGGKAPNKGKRKREGESTTRWKNNKKAKTGAPNSPIVVSPSDRISTGSAVSSIDKTPKKFKKKKQELQTFPKGESTTWKDNGKAKTTAPSPPIDVSPPDPFSTGSAVSSSDMTPTCLPSTSENRMEHLDGDPSTSNNAGNQHSAATSSETSPSRRNREFVHDIVRKTIEATKDWITESHPIFKAEKISSPEIIEKFYSKHGTAHSLNPFLKSTTTPSNEAAYELLPDPSEEWFQNWHLDQKTFMKLMLLKPKEIEEFVGKMPADFNIYLFRNILNYVQLKCTDLELEKKTRENSKKEVRLEEKKEAESKIAKLFEDRSYIKKDNLYSREIPTDATLEDTEKILREKLLFLSLSVTEQANVLVPMIDMKEAHELLKVDRSEKFDTEQLMEELSTTLKTKSRLEIFCAKLLNDKDWAENWRTSKSRQRQRMNRIIRNWLGLDELGRILFLMLDWLPYHKKNELLPKSTKEQKKMHWEDCWKVDIATLPFFRFATDEIVDGDLKTFFVVDRLREIVTKDPEEFKKVLNFEKTPDTFPYDSDLSVGSGWKQFARAIELTKNEEYQFAKEYFEVDDKNFHDYMEGEKRRKNLSNGVKEKIISKITSFLTLSQGKKMRIILRFFNGKAMKVPKYSFMSRRRFLKYLDSTHSAIPNVYDVINELDKSNITRHIKDNWLKCSEEVLEKAKGKDWHELDMERKPILRAYNYLELSEKDRKQVLGIVKSDNEENGTELTGAQALRVGEILRNKREESMIQCAGELMVPYMNVYKCAKDNQLL